jgi:alcohol dehydrogenase, propanol-preferring
MVGWGRPPELCEVPVPEPGPGEVLVKVAGAGACHSDLHLMEWPEGAVPYALPFTLGHENAGWVEQVGGGVDGWRAGDAVAVCGPWGCGRCGECRRGRETLCERLGRAGVWGGGLGRDGGMAEFMLVPDARLLVALDGLDPRDAAPLTDAALTPYHAIKRSLPLLVPGSTALLIGIGGLGHLGVQIVRALSAARIVAVDLSAEKLRLARDVGAHETVEAGPAAAAAVMELTGGLGAELVVDFVGADATMALAAAAVRRGGDAAIIGLGGGSLRYALGALPFDATLTTPYWGTATELSEVLELARAGAITAHTQRFPLDHVAEAYERLRDGTLDGRAVVCP